MEKLTRAEVEALNMLAKECHEEMVRGVNPFVVPKCNQCRKFIRGTVTCQVYPSGIPKEISGNRQNCPKFEKK